MANHLNPQNLTPGNPGNKGGGRPKNRIRELCAEGFAKALPRIIKIASGEEDGVTPGESVNGFDKLGKYGLGEAKTVVPEEIITAFAEVLADEQSIPSELIPILVQKLIDKLKDE